MKEEDFFTLNCSGKLFCVDAPKVMGILNITPDSFYDGGKYTNTYNALKQVEKMLGDGADIIDIGAATSKPSAIEINEREEIQRLIPVLQSIVKEFANAIISVDTYRSNVALQAIDNGASIINDIYAATYDEKILTICANHRIPIVLMHMQNNPSTMQNNPKYSNVCETVLHFFIERIALCRSIGVHDIILDVGFGFGKTIEHNYQLLKNLSDFRMLNKTMLVGLSRKSMLYKLVGTLPEYALHATAVAHILALQNGAHILRVHDVKEAKECIKIFEYYKNT